MSLVNQHLVRFASRSVNIDQYTHDATGQRFINGAMFRSSLFSAGQRPIEVAEAKQVVRSMTAAQTGWECLPIPDLSDEQIEALCRGECVAV